VGPWCASRHGDRRIDDGEQRQGARAESAAFPRRVDGGGLGGYRKLIDSGVEAVVLKVPPYFIPEQAKAAVEAGCHVYTAKPVAVDVPGSPVP